MRTTARLVAIALLGMTTAVAGAQQRELTRILDSVRAATDLPALGAAIVTSDSVLALDVVGVRRLGDTTRATKNDLFHIGSDTKAMTAGLLGLLVDRGRLKWTSTLAELFPDLAAGMRPEYRTLQVRELLSHQSGLVPNPTIAFNDGTPRAQRVAFLKWVLAQPPATERGKYSYANSNYIVAGAIAERLLDGEYEALVVDQLLRPLGITSVGFGAPGTPGRVDQPWPHTVNAAGKPRPVPPGPDADNPPVFGPAGRAHLTLADWSIWIRTVLRAARGGPSPWTAATAKALVTPVVQLDPATGYAFGWLVTTRPWAGPGGRAITHAGSNTANFAVAWIAPEANFAVLVVTNQGGDAAARDADGLAGRLILLHTQR
ncbi:MAG: serine hydrolase domain-containing protein [Gemmatimonadaceae bacterium]